jgi:hypothetical protein
MSMFDEKPTTKAQEFWSANGIEAEAGTNHPQGGDAGHGGRTYVRLTDLAGTAWQVRITADGKKTLVDGPKTVELVLGGDTEHDTLVQALRFVLSQLER